MSISKRSNSPVHAGLNSIPMEEKSRKLTEKQQRFVEYYFLSLNATQAAIKAGYSERRASEIGYQLLQKTTVQNRISDMQAKAREMTEITKKEVIQILSSIIRNDTTEFFDGKKLRPFNELKPDQRLAIESIKVTKAGIEIKPSNRIQAIQTLSKMVGWESPLGVNFKLENLDDNDLNLLIEKLFERH